MAAGSWLRTPGAASPAGTSTSTACHRQARRTLAAPSARSGSSSSHPSAEHATQDTEPPVGEHDTSPPCPSSSERCEWSSAASSPPCSNSRPAVTRLPGRNPIQGRRAGDSRCPCRRALRRQGGARPLPARNRPGLPAGAPPTPAHGRRVTGARRAPPRRSQARHRAARESMRRARQPRGLRVMGLVAPPKSAGTLARARGVLIVVALIVLILLLGFAIVSLISIPAGGMSLDLRIFWAWSSSWWRSGCWRCLDGGARKPPWPSAKSRWRHDRAGGRPGRGGYVRALHLGGAGPALPCDARFPIGESQQVRPDPLQRRSGGRCARRHQPHREGHPRGELFRLGLVTRGPRRPTPA